MVDLISFSCGPGSRRNSLVPEIVCRPIGQFKPATTGKYATEPDRFAQSWLILTCRDRRLLECGRGRREFDLISRRLIEQYESFHACDLVRHELPDLTLRCGVSLHWPVERMAYFKRNARSILGRHKCRLVQVDRLIAAQTAGGLEPAHNHDVRPAREPVVNIRPIVQVIEKDHGRVSGIHFAYPHSRERALNRARVPCVGGRGGRPKTRKSRDNEYQQRERANR